MAEKRASQHTEAAEVKKPKHEAPKTDPTAAANAVVQGSGTKKAGDKVSGPPDKGRGTILEKGLVYFFYRPKVELDAAHSLNDVQRLYILMAPAATTKMHARQLGSPKRLIVVGRKKLPPTESHGKAWAIITRVTDSIREIDDLLGPEKYQTETRGERHVAAARPAGEGVYAIVQHTKKKATHFAYVLEMPRDLGEVQEAFNIDKEGSFIISMKNPETESMYGNAAGSSESKKPTLTHALREEFAGRRWAPASTGLLNVENMELLLIGAAKDVEFNLGEAGEDLRKTEMYDESRICDEKLFKELHMKPSEHPSGSLIEGEWA